MTDIPNNTNPSASHGKPKGPHLWDASWLNHQPTLICFRCKIELPANPAWFRIRKTSRTGLQSWCRCCEARYYDENKAKRHAGQKAYYEKMRAEKPEVLRAQRAAWRERNVEKYRASCRKWREQNHDLAKSRQVAAENKRRAQKRKTHGSFTPKDIDKMLTAQKGKCWYCSKKMSKYHVEHRIPLARGGSNGPENLVLACPPCNFSKGVKMPWELKVPRLL